jgi:type IV pilus assembly protein PilM
MRLLPTSLLMAVRPRLACEIAPDGIFAAGSASMESPLDATAYVPLRDSISAGLSAPMFRDRGAVAAALRSALDSVSPNGRDWTLILPDACTRVLLLDFDTLPAKPQEILPLVRFRMRRMIPFDADTAAVSYQLLKPASTPGKAAPVQVIAAAMPAEVRDEIESLMRESEREPGTLLPATLAALAAVPEIGSHLLVHTGEHSITTAITRNGELLLYRRTEHSEAEPGEMAQAILVAAAYYEDTLHTTLEEVWVAGFETPDALRGHLEQDGEWRIPLRSLITSEAFSAAAAPAHVAASRYTSVAGALRG